MFLYDKKDKSLDIYDFTANKNDLVNYRMAQLEQLPEDDRVFVAETHIDPYGDIPLFEQYNVETFNDLILPANYADNDSEERKNGDAYRRYHVLKRDRRSKRNNEILLDCYRYGFLSDRPIVQIQYDETVKYYLLKKAKYSFLSSDKYGKNYIMEDIIQLPETLYLLQLIEQGKFNSLDGKSVAEQLSLYSLSKINEIGFEEIQKMDACGITEGICTNIINKANNDSHVLRLIKK